MPRWNLIRRKNRQMLVNGMTVKELIALKRDEFGDARMDDPPERPADVTQEEWDALGDPGRRAIDRVKRAEREAVRQREAAAAAQAEAEKQRDAARTEAEALRKNPPKQDPPKDPPDVAAQIQQAVAAALENVTKTYNEQLDQLRAERTAEQLTAQAQRIATDVMVDPSLVGTFVDLRTVLSPQGQLDEQALRDNLAAVLEQRPYLKKPDAPPGGGAPGGNPFGGHPGGARPPSDKATFDARVSEQLALARQSGLTTKTDIAKSSAST